MPHSLGMEWHSPFGVYQTSLWLVGFSKKEDGDVEQYLPVVMPLKVLSFRVDSCSGEVLPDCFGCPISLDPELLVMIASERWETDPNFPEVPWLTNS